MRKQTQGAATTARVLVLGALNIDRTLRVAHLPLPGETLLSRTMVVSCGGKGRNQAAAVAALGGAARLIGSVGDDAEGSQLLVDLRSRGVDDSSVTVTAEARTGIALIVVDEEGENSIVVHPGANDMVAADFEATFDAADGSILLASLEVPLPGVASAVASARQRGLLSVVNASPMPPSESTAFRAIVAATDILIVNRGEACALVEADPADDTVLVERLRAWHAGTGVRVVMTAGAGGAVAVDAEGARSFQSPPVRAVNTVGAGDVFAAMLCVALATQSSLDEGVMLACAAGAIAVSAPESLFLERVLEVAQATYASTPRSWAGR